MQQEIKELKEALLNITMKELLEEKEMLYDELADLQKVITDLILCISGRKKREPSGLNKGDLGYKIRRLKQ